jgi:phosphohistidine phosphatase
MGKRLKERGVHPDLMVCSTAVRSEETCRILARELGYPPDKIKINKLVYHASEEQLLEVIRAFADFGAVMMVGHNPGLTEFTNRLLDDSVDNLPTCAVVAGRLNIKSWKVVTWGCGKREFFDSPKERND